MSLSVAVMSARALPFLLPLTMPGCLSAIAICLAADAVLHVVAICAVVLQFARNESWFALLSCCCATFIFFLSVFWFGVTLSFVKNILVPTIATKGWLFVPYC